MIRLIKEYEGKWCVFNSRNGKCADISKINEHHALKGVKPRYRVDHNGKTIGTMLENFQTARGIASRAVRGA